MSIIDGEDLDDNEMSAFDGLFNREESDEDTREIDFDVDAVRETELDDEED